MPDERCTPVVQNTMAFSPPRNRRRIVGLNDPRAARAHATDAEQRRLALQQIVQQGRMGLDIPSDAYEDSEADEFNLDSDSDSDDAAAAAAPPPPPAEAVPQSAPIQVQAAAPAPRNRYFWVGNDTKLNIVARRFLLQPQRQEMAAMAANDPERISEIRLLKRDQNKDFDHDNFKHSAHSFLVQKTCEELNTDRAFVESHLPPNSSLNAELLRQKIKEFQQIAVNTNIQDIVPRNLFLSCVCQHFPNNGSFQIGSSGSMISEKYTINSSSRVVPFNKTQNLGFRTGRTSTMRLVL
jgi:hypothetical protein